MPTLPDPRPLARRPLALIPPLIEPLADVFDPVVGTVLRPARQVVEPVRSAVADRVATTLRGPDATEGDDDFAGFAAPAGDPGWFGPGSMVWRVHSDVPSMLVGGISALLFQTLHPLAMAGVADHSDFKARPFGRLQRTAAFIGTTSFGGTAAADEAVAVVRAVHRHVHGTAPDGRRYDANDPDLLTWVHVAEVGSFLRGYQRYSGRPLTPVQCDRYFAEVARVADELGARDVPRSSAEVRQYLRRMRPQLRAGADALDTVDFLLGAGGTRPEERAVYGLILQGSIDLLPSWARRHLRLRRLPLVDTVGVRPAAFALLSTLRWAIGPTPVRQVAEARARATTRTA